MAIAVSHTILMDSNNAAPVVAYRSITTIYNSNEKISGDHLMEEDLKVVKKWLEVNKFTVPLITCKRSSFPKNETNKMASHRRHIFCRLVLLKILFRKTKAFFQKKILSSSIFENFSHCKIFLTSAESLKFRRKKRQFCEMISLNMHSAANLPAIPILKMNQVFFENNLTIFPPPPPPPPQKKIKQISYILRNFTISVAYYG